jgi:EAL domain-containing protein (putative c-di-GMP-specific phosphodiesterase class I)
MCIRDSKDIDLCQYIRSQTIYEYQKDKSWRQIIDETFVGLEEVRVKFFPHLDVTQPKHLFLELCQVLDRNLLEALTLNYDSVNDMTLSLNLSIHTVLGMEFAQFTHRIPRANRARIGFEIHCGDLLQDFAQTLNAIGTMHQEGYRVAIDGITPDMLTYFNFERFNVDFIKINVSKDYATSLKYQAIREGIARAPRDKLIFFHCDSEQALMAGIDIGVTKFQGWLIDDQARKWRKS